MTVPIPSPECDNEDTEWAITQPNLRVFPQPKGCGFEWREPINSACGTQLYPVLRPSLFDQPVRVRIGYPVVGPRLILDTRTRDGR
jgi:hypothetical protein